MKKLLRLLGNNRVLFPETEPVADTTGVSGTVASGTEPADTTNILADAGKEDPAGTQEPGETKPSESNPDNKPQLEPSKKEEPGIETILTKDTAGKPGEAGTAKAEEGEEGKNPTTELKGVEGVDYEDGELNELQALCQEHSISPDAAKAILDWQAKFARMSMEKRDQSIQREIKEYVKEEAQKNLDLVRKEWGGNPRVIAANEAALAHAMRLFGDDELRNLLAETGLGNHPAMVRFVLKAGKAVAEDRFPGGRNGSKQESPAHRMFPNLK